jgi:DNA sulfur modification protein DndD
MPTVVTILGWKAEGLRCPNHEVNFFDSADDVFPITLIQMPNGTGKTTTLELLRATLSGAAAGGRWDAEKVLSLRKREPLATEGLFQVVLLVNAKRVTIRLTFDFEEGTVRTTTTVGKGMLEGFQPPREVHHFLQPEFVRFFIFDGELADHLLSHDHTDAQTVIEDLFQLRLFTSVAHHVGDYWQKQTERKSATEERGLARRRNRVTSLKARLQLMRSEQEDTKKKHAKVKRQLTNKTSKFDSSLAALKELGEKIAKANDDLTKETTQVESAVHVLFDEMRNPHALSAVFAHELDSLKKSFDRVKLPENTAREFFEELACEQFCVCGTKLDEATREAIQVRAKQYLGSDDVALLNAIKGDITLQVGADSDAHESRLKVCVTNLNKHTKKQGELRTQREAIENEGVAGNPALEAVKEEIAALDRLSSELEQELGKYDSSDDTGPDEKICGIKALERRLAEAELNLAEITKTIQLREKRDTLLGILEQAHLSAREGISEEICTQANTRITKLMPNNAIRVSKVSSCLVLEGQEGGSVGENLSVAYAFLATLFNRRADHNLPFVVDSPANPIDLLVRSKVAELIPQLGHQFIAFTISSEREGFLPTLERHAGKTIQYITLFRKGDAVIEASAKRQTERHETVDGICVHGREFFRNFHVNQEGTDDAVPTPARRTKVVPRRRK